MTVDERIERLAVAQEELTAAQKQLTAAQAKNEILMARVLESIMRLERIVVSHSFSIEEIEARLDELEKRQHRKPE